MSRAPTSHDDAAVRATRANAVDGALDHVGSRTRSGSPPSQPTGPRPGWRRLPIPRVGGGIAKDRHRVTWARSPSELSHAGDVAAGTRQARDEAGAHRIDELANTIGTVRVACLQRRTTGRPATRMTSGRSATIPSRICGIARQLPAPSGCRSAHCGRLSSPIAGAPARTLRHGVCPSGSSAPYHQHADPPHALCLLRAPRAATPPPRRRAA